MSVNKIRYVVDNNLCVRCGTCVGVCPLNAITLNDRNYPVKNSSCTGCGHCIEVCPGIDVDFPELTMQLFRKRFNINGLLGFFTNAYAGYALDPDIRANASSGGVITQLLIYLLEKKIIDGAIVAVTDPEAPCQSKPIIAKTKDELLQSMQSRYTIIPVNQLFGKIRQMEGKFALVGLPCHIHGFRKLANIDPVIRDRIYLVLGLYCNLNLEQEATLDLQKISRISQKEIKNFEYRGGEWPGAIRITKKNGNTHNLHYSNYKDGAFNYLSRLYYAKRCLYCIDGSSELADISFADPWVQDGNGDWVFKGGWTLIFERTEKGGMLLAEAERDHAIFLKRLYGYSMFKRFINNINKKRKMALVRLSNLKNKNKPAPEYHVDDPTIPVKDRLKEYIFSLTLVFGKYEGVRKIITAIIFSRIGISLTKLRIFLKYRVSNIRLSNRRF
ncbi:coenzyme F420-reducing hydrogenase, beta subunit [Candidatus Methanoperedens nitroreducens]|uniref:Coenzyme F420-reducing hydrogenase, beta subunit n=1 Tax=Candidatus Methanoperedens nitratireducens TaxID=1392998 RepID=A0A062V6U9_9EURY|nr:Coenzyme F420 hydrogenase/dehydrogenase, beta subunit C-terminal domain [Candidatus Methanoperedens nitroreducens]KCZ72308.1 coenzyme F420-reducing hydrogenase, beta subunit [Candidatus Methanoperedens nitroreducens]MDJ1420772.1 Coenzyme F420 hydrogenase/dehydrogenase, beta subunit C-terminal domain [Candidatus Methanoperedens sp.]